MKQCDIFFTRYLVIFTILITTVHLHAQYDSILFDDIYRTYLVHLPPEYADTTKLPLVIAMHGGFGNAYNMENQSQFSDKADLENFIVVYPEGIKGGILGISSWNAGTCCGYASISNVDDVGFINALLDTLINNYAVDTSRFYVTGMSNGGFMSYRLACELSYRIAAIAPVAASMTVPSCNSQRAMPIISFHSYLDTSIPYEGGVGDGVSDHYNPPQDSVLNAWASLNKCSVLNDTIINNQQFTEIKWTNCNCATELYQYVTQDGGHSWPGGNQTAIGDSVSKYIDATDLIWDFFQQYSLECNSSTTINTFYKNEDFVKIFPNPTSRSAYIQIDEKWNDFEISIYTIMGKQVYFQKNQSEIDFNNMKNGIYLIQVKIDDKIEMHRIIKTK